MVSNERNHRKTEKEIKFPTKIYKTKQGITEKESKIEKEFKNFFTSVGTVLPSKIPIVTKDVSE